MLPEDLQFVEEAYKLAKKSFDEGGLPIGAVLVRGGDVIGRGHNRRLQQNNPTAHGEIDCLRDAGNQTNYRSTTLYTSLSPCMMCAGAIAQFAIPRVVIGENRTFGGNEAFLQERGIEVVVADHQGCVDLMKRAQSERPADWDQDIGAG